MEPNLLTNLDYDMLEEQFQYDYEDDLQETLHELYQHCIKATLLDVYPNLVKMFLLCLCFRICTQLLPYNKTALHITSSILGIIILYIFLDKMILHTFTIILIAYLSLKILVCFIKNKYKGYAMSTFLFTYLTLLEFSMIERQTWERIRGAQMIISMKIISYSFDIDKCIIKELKWLDYLGYTLCPANCIFGPWVSFTEYKNIQSNKSWGFKWILKILYSFLLSVLFFLCSVCLLEWFITDESSILWIVFRNAMLFRVGHYFVSYISEVTCVLCGFGGPKWDIQVTKPFQIELPYSLVQVVINWNLPMHKWLKNYVFKVFLPFGNFFAIMSTYFVSALLHGLNIRLAAVLVSLGLYTYIEYSFRKLLSSTFSACISAKPCPSKCKKHKRTTNNLIVHMINIFFLLATMFHLAYLGVLIHDSHSKRFNIKNSFYEWSILRFSSHWIVLATFFIYLIIKTVS